MLAFLPILFSGQRVPSTFDHHPPVIVQQQASSNAPRVAQAVASGIASIVKPTPKFPDMTANYQTNSYATVKTACDARRGVLEADLSCYVAPPVIVIPTPPVVYPAPVVAVVEHLNGTLGYSLPYGNCVDEPGVNDPYDGTNPISWAITSNLPWIGASALFRFNHVAVVTGIWSNGDIEVRQRNCPNCATRFPLGDFRGFR